MHGSQMLVSHVLGWFFGKCPSPLNPPPPPSHTHTLLFFAIRNAIKLLKEQLLIAHANGELCLHYVMTRSRSFKSLVWHMSKSLTSVTPNLSHLLPNWLEYRLFSKRENRMTQTIIDLHQSYQWSPKFLKNLSMNSYIIISMTMIY